MKLIVGLGNPGLPYKNTRHNLGFMALDALADELGAKFRKDPRSNSLKAEPAFNQIKVILCKPLTYMNLSGISVLQEVRFAKIPLENIIVIHDDLDLAVGKVRVKTGGGSGGHNGLKDIDARLGKEYRRVRIGIGHPGHKDRVHGYVLGNYHKSEGDALADMLGAIGAEAEWLAKGDDARFMNEVALRLAS